MRPTASSDAVEVPFGGHLVEDATGCRARAIGRVERRALQHANAGGRKNPGLTPNQDAHGRSLSVWPSWSVPDSRRAHVAIEDRHVRRKRRRLHTRNARRGVPPACGRTPRGARRRRTARPGRSKRYVSSGADLESQVDPCAGAASTGRRAPRRPAATTRARPARRSARSCAGPRSARRSCARRAAISALTDRPADSAGHSVNSSGVASDSAQREDQHVADRSMSVRRNGSYAAAVMSRRPP